MTSFDKFALGGESSNQWSLVTGRVFRGIMPALGPVIPDFCHLEVHR